MVKPPQAERVRAARTFVPAAGEPSGPPPIASTQSRTVANAGSAATTAPNPTRLATLTAGRTDALAPASMLWRTAGRRLRVQAMTAAPAPASATQPPPPPG